LPEAASASCDSPPYVGFGVTGGITFTFGGLRVDTRAEALDTSDQPIPGLFAAGELLYLNYPGGSGLMSGAVFGKTAGGFAAGSLAEALPARPTPARRTAKARSLSWSLSLIHAPSRGHLRRRG